MFDPFRNYAFYNDLEITAEECCILCMTMEEVCAVNVWFGNGANQGKLNHRTSNIPGNPRSNSTLLKRRTTFNAKRVAVSTGTCVRLAIVGQEGGSVQEGYGIGTLFSAGETNVVTLAGNGYCVKWDMANSDGVIPL